MSPAWIDLRAALAPREPALVAGETVLSWADLAERARRLARALRARGAREGERVAALLGNDPDAVALFHAAGLAGLVLVPLDIRHTAVEIAAALRDAGVGLLVHGSGGLGERAGGAAAQVPGLALVACSRLVAESSPRVELPRFDAARPLALVYTSGTTGRPKGVVLTHASFLWSALASATHLGAPPAERWLACLPLWHVGGLAILARSALFGATVVLHERFDPAEVSRSLDRDAVTIASFVPTMLRRLLEARGAAAPPAQLRCALVGGAATPADLREEAWQRGWPVVPSYGLSEAGSQVATLPLGEIGRRHDGALRPLLGVEVEIRDANDRALAAGVQGEIAVRSPASMLGYLGQPEASARALRGGWLRTGDVGILGEDGFLRVLDRREDLIVTGGENVSPAEVEAVLESHPGVIEAAVAGERDSDLGQRVAAWIVPRRAARDSGTPSAAALLAELQSYGRTRLAGYKLPRRLYLVSELPRTDSGKLRRRALAPPPASG